MKTLSLAALIAALPAAVLAHDGMHVNDAYARSTNPMVASVFLQLENHRAVDCSLQAVTTQAAERAELHTHTEENGVMKMGQIPEIAVPAGQTHALSRGGDHIMLLGLTEPLADGDAVSLELDFGDCGQETVEAVVDNARADAGMDHGAGGGGHGDHAGH